MWVTAWKRCNAVARGEATKRATRGDKWRRDNEIPSTLGGRGRDQSVLSGRYACTIPPSGSGSVPTRSRPVRTALGRPLLIVRFRVGVDVCISLTKLTENPKMWNYTST